MEVNIFEFIIDKALVLIPALWIIGKMLKATPKVPDWTIPWVLLALGVGGSLALIGLTVEAGVQGVLVAGAAVFVHQLVKQTMKQEANVN